MSGVDPLKLDGNITDAVDAFHVIRVISEYLLDATADHFGRDVHVSVTVEVNRVEVKEGEEENAG